MGGVKRRALPCSALPGTAVISLANLRKSSLIICGFQLVTYGLQGSSFSLTRSAYRRLVGLAQDGRKRSLNSFLENTDIEESVIEV